MRLLPASVGTLFLALGVAPLPAQIEAPLDSSQFIVGRHTFFDFGPPTDYYEIFVVKQADDGSKVQKITLTPEVNKCYAPAKVELAEGISKSPVVELLGGLDPCRISEKELKKERGRKKQEQVYSGAHVTLQVQCGGKSRIIRTDVLEKDWFLANPHTPRDTSWTMQVLRKLDEATGPGVMDKPFFAMPQDNNPAPGLTDPLLIDSLESGKLDALFPDAPDKASDVYKASLVTPLKPTVQLVSSVPVQPTDLKIPMFPPLARIVSVEGLISSFLTIDSEGNVSSVDQIDGPKLLQGVAKDALLQSKFPPGIKITFNFQLNCHVSPKP